MSWTNPFVRKNAIPVFNYKERTTIIYLDANFQSLLFVDLALPDASPVVAFGEILINSVVNTHFTIEYYIQFTNSATAKPYLGTTRSFTGVNSNGHQHSISLCEPLLTNLSSGVNTIRIFARCVNGESHATTTFTGLTAMGQLEKV